MTMNNQEKLVNETKELNEQFTEFLHTKGIKAKFKLAFNNMNDSINYQHEQDVKSFKEIKEKSIEENKDFYDFMHTKGLKAKIQLVIENIKKGARESSQKVREQIEASKNIQTFQNINITVEELNNEFNNFLKQKGLDSKYIVIIEEVNN